MQIASINLQLEDGTYESIICEWYVEPENLGDMLLRYYNEKELVEELLEMGSLVEIGETIESSIFKNRDRGESEEKAYIGEEIDTICCDFNYLWKNDQWMIQSEDYANKDYFVLTFDVIQHDEKYLEAYDEEIF